MERFNRQHGFIGELLLLVVVLALAAFVLIKALQIHRTTASVTDFASCSKAGYPVMLTYPETCRTPDGRSFTHSN